MRRQQQMIKSVVFWVMKLCSPASVQQSFEGTCYPEDGGSKFHCCDHLWNCNVIILKAVAKSQQQNMQEVIFST